MKNVKFLLSAACALFAVAAMAQQDFSDPKYAVWGDTPQEREQNILNSNFLKESLDNKDYNAAAHYLKELLDKCPKASQNTFVRGITLYKNKIARAKSIAEKNTYTDSLMIVYDLRNEYFGDHPKYGTPYILDRKAREYLMYKPADRKGIREAFRAAIEAGGDNTDPETVVAYFSNLCDDYRNTDEVMPDEIIAEYDRLTPFFEKNPAAAEYKSQFDAAFGLSGAASCENLERLFKGKLAAAPDDEALLAQVRAKSEYLFSAFEGKPGIEQVSGLGLMIGLRTAKPAAEVVAKCMEQGVLVLTAHGKVRLLPALNIPMELVKKAAEVIIAACA